MENISEVIWEVIYVIIFALGITFIFTLFNMMNDSGDIINKEVRQKADIVEDNTGYTGHNIVTGTSVYYDIINSAKDIRENKDDMYKIVIKNSDSDAGVEISQTMILDTENGKTTELLGFINPGAYYEKKYSQNDKGLISQVTYIYKGTEMDKAKGIK